MRCRLLIPALAVALLTQGVSDAAPLIPATQVGRAVVAQLEVDNLLTGRDVAKLIAYFRNRANPATHRAAALNAVYAGKKAPLSREELQLLNDALLDVEAPVRTQAVRLGGALNEQSVSRQILELAANDRDQWVRVAALIAVRPWTRLTHLYFLEGALASKSELVKAQAVASIALLSSREVEPRLLKRIAEMSDPTNPPMVRRVALDAMKGWGMLDWETLRLVIADPDAGDTLRVEAMELSDTLPDALAQRSPTLMDIVTRESSVNLVWHAFKRLKSIARNDRAFIQGLAKLLSGSTQYNTATSDMAVFLKNVGVKSVFRDGSWEVGGAR